MTVNYYSTISKKINGFDYIQLNKIKPLRRSPFALLIKNLDDFKKQYGEYLNKLTGILILTDCKEFNGYFVGNNVFVLEFPNELNNFIRKIAETAITFFIMYKEESNQNIALQLEYNNIKRDFSKAIEYSATIDRLIKNNFEKKAQWEVKALKKLVDFAVNRLRIIELEMFPQEICKFLYDDFFGYESVAIYSYDKNKLKWETLYKLGKEFNEDNLNFKIYKKNKILINNNNIKVFNNFQNNIYLISINKKTTDSDFSDYDISFTSMFQTLINALYNMKRSTFFLQKKIVEISNIRASNDIIAALREDKISLKKAVEELYISQSLKGILFAVPEEHGKYKIEWKKGTNIHSWDDFLNFYKNSDKNSKDWIIHYLIDSRYYIYGIIAFKLTREDNSIFTTQQRILENIIPQLILVLSEKRSHKEAITDPLTGLFNRRYIDEELKNKENFLTLNKRFKLSIAMLDIDDFKIVNDTYGHKVGDTVLINTARIIKETLRDVDIVGRYGGEEFIVLIQANLKTSTLICERIRNNIENAKVKDKNLHVTVSIGISEFLPNNTFKDIVNNADKNLYLAKSKGKNIVIH